MDGDTFHNLEEFGNFPWDTLDPEMAGIGYGGIHCGVDCNPRMPTIQFVHQDGSADIWRIPENLALFLEEYRRRGDEDARNEIRMAIGALKA